MKLQSSVDLLFVKPTDTTSLRKSNWEGKTRLNRYLTESGEVLFIVLNTLLLLRAVFALAEVITLSRALIINDVLGSLDQRIGVLGLLGVESGLILDLLLDKLNIGIIDDNRLGVLDWLFVGQEVELKTAFSNVFIGSDDFFDLGLLLLDLGLFLVVLIFFVLFLGSLLIMANIALSVTTLLEVIGKGGTTSAAVSLEGTLLSGSVVTLVTRRIVRRLMGFFVGRIAISIAKLLVSLTAFLFGGTRSLRLDWLLFVIAVIVLEYAEDIFRHYNFKNHVK